MDWLLLGKLTTFDAFVLVWFFGAIGGYCFGRAHAAWITLNKFMDVNSK